MLLTSSGEGSVLIDADVIYHPSGFPFIPARRVKGLLRESMEEVLEMHGKNNEEIKGTLISVFGTGGSQVNEGKLVIDNLYIVSWEAVLTEIKQHRHPAFQPDLIKSFFTSEIQQTAIGEDEVAKDKSLRNYRVINPGHSFEAVITALEALTSDEWDYLQKAVRNLRYAGTRRNRGFGKIACSIEADNTALSPNQPESSQTVNEHLSVSITTLSPVVLAQQLGEQNTVYTLRHISGSHIRGFLAEAFIRTQGLDRNNAHLDPDFYNIFLSGKVRFGALTMGQGKMIPQHIQTIKGDASKPPISVFSNNSEVTRPISRLGKVVNGVVDTNGFNPKTTLFFHNSRINRAAGRSKEDEGAIFYYESIDENQTFHGEITGDTTSLNRLLKVFPAKLSGRIGRSKSAQYGKVEVVFGATPDSVAGQKTFKTGQQYILTVESPLVLLNENGLPKPDADLLKDYLETILGAKTVIKRAETNITPIEQYNTSWESKSGKVQAFREGSSFLIELQKDVTISQPIEYLGEWNEQGFGKVSLTHFTPEQQYVLPTLEETETPEIKEITTLNSPLLNEILSTYAKQMDELSAKNAAISDATKIGGLKNHLIGRLERLFMQSDSEEKILSWFNDINKPAKDALIKAELFDDSKDRFKLDKYKPSKNERAFELQKIYWITFFQTLRKQNKANGR